MSRNKRQQRKKNKNFLGTVLIIFVLSVFVLGATYYFKIQSRQQSYDQETLCPLNLPSSEYLALVFDKSDVYNKIQQSYLKRFFNNLKAELMPGTRISIFLIESLDGKEIQPDYVVCVPRTGEDANVFYENPKQIKKRWKEQFEKPLDQAIAGFMQPSQAEFSPIMEIFQYISLTAFPSGEETAEKKVIIISDMLQHTPEWSHYRGQFDLNQLMRNNYYQRIRTDLENAEVKILYVRRDGNEHLQNKRHAYFWSDFIQSLGGRVTLIEKIDG